MKKMKKIIFALIIIITCLLIKVNAQVSIGPKVGFNWAMITDTTSAGFKGVLTNGTHFGAVINYAINDKYSIQPEIIYSSKGSEQQTEDGAYYQKFSTSYIEIPILVKRTFGKKAFKGFVNAGPYFGYWTAGKYLWNDPEGIYDMNYKFEEIDLGTTKLKDNRLDIGINVGGGLLYAVGPGNFMLDARFGYGLTNINKYSGDKLPGWINKHNRVLSVSVGYLFNLN